MNPTRGGSQGIYNMMSVSNQCLLMQIQPTILRFAKMLASVLQLEVEIVDANMVRVAGTGPYGKFFGRQLEGDSRLLRYVIEHQREKIVTHTSEDPVCEGCSCKESCRERAFLGVPIMVEENCIGVISLVAFNPEQQARLNNNLQEVCDYVQHISSIFVAKLLDSRGLSDGVNKVFLSLMNHMDQGCLLLDEKSQLLYANEVALKQLNCQQEALLGCEIGLRPLTFAQQGLTGHLQHIVTLGDRQELIIGQLHHVQGQQLFLMAFHQSHGTPSQPLEPDEGVSMLIGESKPMRALKKLLHRIALSPSSVLVCGESGTGKEVVARAIHRLSPRRDKPFIAINCAAIPEQLLESELFGYVKGAFTGASSTGKQGLIQAAQQGTLFLDEIGDMPLTMQAKLLRVLELREVTPHWRQPAGAGGYSHHSRDPSASGAVHRRGQVSRGSLLSPQRHSHPPAAPARAGGGRGAADPLLPQPAHQPHRPAVSGAQPGGDGSARRLPLARQRARAQQPHRVPGERGAGGGGDREHPAAPPISCATSAVGRTSRLGARRRSRACRSRPTLIPMACWPTLRSAMPLATRHRLPGRPGHRQRQACQSRLPARSSAGWRCHLAKTGWRTWKSR